MTQTLPDDVDLHRLVTDEPPLGLTVGAVLQNGHRRRVRRRVAMAGSAAGAAAVATLGAAALAGGAGSPSDQLTVTPFALSGAAAGVTAAAQPGLTPDQQRVATAIASASPAGWTFDFAADRWDGSGVEATADDGTGPGRLMVGISTADQLLHPCADAEFSAGATCTERALSDGSVLSMRGVVDARGTQYVDVVVTHPDGSGVMAESGNYVLNWPPPRVATPEQKQHLTHVTRNAPTYDADQLAKVVLAVDRATS